MAINLEFHQPKLIVRSIAPHKAVRVIGTVTLNPYQQIEIFSAVGNDLPESAILAALHKPFGDIYLGVEVYKTIEILEIDLPSWHYNEITQKDLAAAISGESTYAPSTPTTSIINEDEEVAVVAPGKGKAFNWGNFKYPFDLTDGISLPAASATTDGYLKKEFWPPYRVELKTC